MKKVLLFWQNCCETFSVCCETFPTCCETFPDCCENFPECCDTFPKTPLAVKWRRTRSYIVFRGKYKGGTPAREKMYRFAFLSSSLVLASCQHTKDFPDRFRLFYASTAKNWCKASLISKIIYTVFSQLRFILLYFKWQKFKNFVVRGKIHIMFW